MVVANSTLLYTSTKMFPFTGIFLYKKGILGILINYLLWCSSLILLSGDIKTNLGSISSPEQCFSICHWNINSIAAHNYAKLSLLVLILFVFQRDVSTLKLHLMTHVWNYQVICSALITLPIIKKEVFLFIINRHFL